MRWNTGYWPAKVPSSLIGQGMWSTMLFPPRFRKAWTRIRLWCCVWQEAWEGMARESMNDHANMNMTRWAVRAIERRRSWDWQIRGSHSGRLKAWYRVSWCGEVGAKRFIEDTNDRRPGYIVGINTQRRGPMKRRYVVLSYTVMAGLANSLHCRRPSVGTCHRNTRFRNGVLRSIHAAQSR